MAGRAGRRGIDTEGKVNICLWTKIIPQEVKIEIK